MWHFPWGIGRAVTREEIARSDAEAAGGRGRESGLVLSREFLGPFTEGSGLKGSV